MTVWGKMEQPASVGAEAGRRLDNVSGSLPIARHPPPADYLNGAANIKPPSVQRAFKPRSSPRGVFGPTFRSKISP